MNKEKLQQQADKLEKELAILKAEINKPELEPLDEGYVIPASGNVRGFNTMFTDATDTIARHGVLPTRDLAKQAKALQDFHFFLFRLKWEYNGDFKPDWSNLSEAKYCLLFDHQAEQWRWTSYSYMNYGTIGFSYGLSEVLEAVQAKYPN